jgi:hypothetical protein
MPRRPRQRLTDPEYDERISLAPLTAEEAIKALLRTPPPKERNGAKREQKADEKQ